MLCTTIELRLINPLTGRSVKSIKKGKFKVSALDTHIYVWNIGEQSNHVFPYGSFVEFIYY